MPADNFLQIAGIKGESTDDKHKDWIEVLSYNFGVSQSASAAAHSASKAAASQRADFQDLSIVKTMDSSSPLIFKACAKGDSIKEVKLELCRAGGDKQKYMEYKMSDVIISSYNTGGGGGGEATESVTFNYGKIEMTYIPIGRDGKPAGNIPAGWDLTANKPT
ncbi:Type VI secretion system effector, Hcp1 family [uncultured Desulfobacterium sp.]|uniref:Type VI secretion system effector, Hcp1 family n=1 Tax=uncultured Desulfobacterium sp. TaxID=201089 RepID=A0A445MTU7_9BACT|nr:Type VI secretion system effector, Hcp1 family [uncultured Desulfobacterium sp.]